MKNWQLVILYFIAVAGLAYLCFHTVPWLSGPETPQLRLVARRHGQVYELERGLSADECSIALDKAQRQLTRDFVISCD